MTKPVVTRTDRQHAPNVADAIHDAILAASRWCADGRHSEALRLLKRAESAFPGDRSLTYARACTLFAWDRKWEARQILADLQRRRFQHRGLLAMLGWTCLATNDPLPAEAYMREAVEASPGDWESNYGLGAVLRMRDADAAIAAFRAALAANPDNVQCLVSLSLCALDRKDATSAEDYARRALQVSGGNSSAWTNLGMALLMQDRPDEAVAAFSRSELHADSFDDQDLNLGIALCQLGKTRGAIEYFEQRLPLHPSVVAAGHYALALLAAGRFREGWAQYEFRWLQPPLGAQRARYDKPAWTGQDVRGKTVLIRCEQGAGDVFQFIRYAPCLKSTGATVWLELRSGIGILASLFPGVDRIYRPGDRVPDFDFYVDMLSLPGAFGATLDSIPHQVPYLRAPENVRAQWSGRLSRGTELAIGLAWAGDPKHARDAHRSIPLATLAAVMRVEGTRWFSLQKGIAAEALKSSPFSRTIVDLDSDLHEYADTAAVIEQLDLVVTVDTSVAHLAGALGKDVWVLLPFAADWRWMETREDSPWYPTMRLFRQGVAGEWREVVERVKVALMARRVGRSASTWVGRPSVMVPGSAVAVEPTDRDIASVRGIARACRTRVGMIQYIGGLEQSARSIEHYGEYLQTHIEALERLVRPGNFIVEIGAGIGLHTIALASVVAPDGQILAVENSPVLRRILRQNLAANDAKCVSVIPGALTRLPDDSRTAEAGRRETVNFLHDAVTIDGLQLEQLDLIKVGDPTLVRNVLDGAPETLWKHRPVLFLADEALPTAKAHAGEMRDFGYQCWCIESPLFDPANFNRRCEDIFSGANAVALLAIPEETDADAHIREMTAFVSVTRL